MPLRLKDGLTPSSITWQSPTTFHATQTPTTCWPSAAVATTTCEVGRWNSSVTLFTFQVLPHSASSPQMAPMSPFSPLRSVTPAGWPSQAAALENKRQRRRLRRRLDKATGPAAGGACGRCARAQRHAALADVMTGDTSALIPRSGALWQSPKMHHRKLFTDSNVPFLRP